MNQQEMQVDIVMEELAEISAEAISMIKICSKAQRFGLDDHNPHNSIRNDDLLMKEYYEFQSIIENCQENGILPVFDEATINKLKHDKKEKLERYYNYSRKKGTLE